MAIRLDNDKIPTGSSGAADTSQLQQLWNYFTSLFSYFTPQNNTPSPQDQARQSLYFQQAWTNLYQPIQYDRWGFPQDPSLPTFQASGISPADRTELYKLDLESQIRTRETKLAGLQYDLSTITGNATLMQYFPKVEEVKTSINSKSDPNYSSGRKGGMGPWHASLDEAQLGESRAQLDIVRSRYSFAVLDPYNNKVTASQFGWDVNEIHKFLGRKVQEEKLEVQLLKNQLAQVDPYYQLAPVDEFPGEDDYTGLDQALLDDLARINLASPEELLVQVREQHHSAVEKVSHEAKEFYKELSSRFGQNGIQKNVKAFDDLRKTCRPLEYTYEARLRDAERLVREFRGRIRGNNQRNVIIIANHQPEFPDVILFNFYDEDRETRVGYFVITMYQQLFEFSVGFFDLSEVQGNGIGRRFAEVLRSYIPSGVQFNFQMEEAQTRGYLLALLNILTKHGFTTDWSLAPSKKSNSKTGEIAWFSAKDQNYFESILLAEYRKRKTPLFALLESFNAPLKSIRVGLNEKGAVIFQGLAVCGPMDAVLG